VSGFVQGATGPRGQQGLRAPGVLRVLECGGALAHSHSCTLSTAALLAPQPLLALDQDLSSSTPSILAARKAGIAPAASAAPPRRPADMTYVAASSAPTPTSNPDNARVNNAAPTTPAVTPIPASSAVLDTIIDTTATD